MYNKTYSFTHNKIFDLLKCKTDLERLKWIERTLLDNAIPYAKDSFRGKVLQKPDGVAFTNFYLKGTSNRMVIAHYDTVHPEFSANDNSASVINAIILKLQYPQLNVAILDGEEPPYLGEGSHRLSKFIKADYFPGVDEILNLELTGVGRNVCLGARQQSNLKTRFLNKGITEINVPFSDSDILDANGLTNNVVMFLLPSDTNNKPDQKRIYYCHTPNDNPGIIKIEDMEWFTDIYLGDFFLRWL